MLVLPGQGVITILIGLTLLDLPGKRHLELYLVRKRPVLGAINWMRRKAKCPRLRLPPLAELSASANRPLVRHAVGCDGPTDEPGS